MTINICGIPFEVIEVDSIDEAEQGITQAKIFHSRCTIHVRRDLPVILKRQAIIHEVLHGMLELLGFVEYSDDEHFVQALSLAIYQTFDYPWAGKDGEIDEDTIVL